MPNDLIPVQLVCGLPYDVDETQNLQVDVYYLVNDEAATGTGILLQLNYSSTPPNGSEIVTPSNIFLTEAGVTQAATGKVDVYKTTFCIAGNSNL